MYDPQAPSFKLYRRKRFVPEKTVKDYTGVELFLYEVEFKKIAEQYEAKNKILNKGRDVFFLCFLLHIASASSGASYAIWFWLAGMATILIALLFSATRAKLLCPACKQNLEKKEFGAFCPECGGELKFKFFSAPECLDCRTKLRFGKARRFKIKSCTFCGIKLHESGV